MFILVIPVSRIGFKLGHVGWKSRSLGQILENISTFGFWMITEVPIGIFSLNMDRMFILSISRMGLKLGHVGWKSRSLCQILENIS